MHTLLLLLVLNVLDEALGSDRISDGMRAAPILPELILALDLAELELCGVGLHRFA